MELDDIFTKNCFRIQIPLTISEDVDGKVTLIETDSPPSESFDDFIANGGEFISKVKWFVDDPRRPCVLLDVHPDPDFAGHYRDWTLVELPMHTNEKFIGYLKDKGVKQIEYNLENELYGYCYWEVKGHKADIVEGLNAMDGLFGSEGYEAYRNDMFGMIFEEGIPYYAATYQVKEIKCFTMINKENFDTLKDKERL